MKSKRKTRFEKLARNIFIVCSLVFTFFSVYCSSLQSAYNRKEAVLRNEIKELQSEKESVEMQITELTTLDSLISVAQASGYQYRFSSNEPTASVNEIQEDTANSQTE